MLPEITRILCIQLRQIGDVLMTTPSVRALARNYPQAKIHFLTETPSDQIYRENPYVDQVITFPRKPGVKDWFRLIQRLRRENYSVVIDFLGLPKTALLSSLIGVSCRIGFRFRGRSLFYSHSLALSPDVKYAPMHKLSLLSILGIESRDCQLEFFTSAEDQKKAGAILQQLQVKAGNPLISVSPVSRRDYKVWPAEKFAAVCDYLIETYSAQILFLWGPGEAHFINEVKAKMNREPLDDYDIPTISETAALIEKVDLHIGNDNGPMHFAIAVNRPTIAIFGRPLAENWTPPNNPNHIAIEYDPGCKRDCHYPHCKLECITDVAIEPVKESIKQILG